MPRAAAWSRPGPMLHRLLLTNGSNFTNFLKAEKRQCPCSIQQRGLGHSPAQHGCHERMHTCTCNSLSNMRELKEDNRIRPQAFLDSRAGELSPDLRLLGDEAQGGCCLENHMVVILGRGDLPRVFATVTQVSVVSIPEGD